MRNLINNLLKIFNEKEVEPVQPVKAELTEEEKERVREVFRHADETENW